MPRISEFIVQHLRTGAESGQFVANVTLPPHAAHNLLLTMDLGLRSAQAAVVSDPAQAARKMTPDEILQLPIAYNAEQQSLDLVLADIASMVQDMIGDGQRFAIELQGTELERRGITRNQQIKHFSAKNVPLESVLTQLVMQANPGPRPSSSSDDSQVLVWTVEKVTIGEEKTIVWITTREAVQNSGGNLPRVFQRK
jgi:hypothetical protein